MWATVASAITVKAIAVTTANSGCVGSCSFKPRAFEISFQASEYVLISTGVVAAMNSAMLRTDWRASATATTERSRSYRGGRFRAKPRIKGRAIPSKGCREGWGKAREDQSTTTRSRARLGSGWSGERGRGRTGGRGGGPPERKPGGGGGAGARGHLAVHDVEAGIGDRAKGEPDPEGPRLRVDEPHQHLGEVLVVGPDVARNRVRKDVIRGQAAGLDHPACNPYVPP